MRRVLGFLCGLALALALFVVADHVTRPVKAQTYVADTGTAPSVSLTPEALCRFWSNQAQANGVNADAGWNTAVANLFSSANWPGVNATSLAFLRSFFVQYVHVGVP